MLRLRLGNAPCSWGTLEFEQTDHTEKPVPFGQMLDELAETGYTGTELGDWGYMPTDAAVLQAELARRKLVMLGGFVPVELKNPAAYEDGLAATLRVFIDYALPEASGTRWFGQIFGNAYARWCTTRMTDDAAKHFN